MRSRRRATRRIACRAHVASARSGCAAVLVPDAARALAAHHAGAHRRVGHALACRTARQSVGDAMPAMMSPQRHSLRQRRTARSPRATRRSMREAAPRVDVRPLVAQAQVAVGHVGDAAPAPADRLGTRARAASCAAQVALARDAAREHVHDRGAAVAHQLDQLHQPGEDVERLEARDHDRAAGGARRTARTRPSR